MKSLNYEDQKLMNNVIFNLGEAEAQKWGKHFSRQGVKTIFDDGASYTQRVRSSIEDLGVRFFNNYKEQNGVSMFFVDVAEEEPTLTVEDATNSLNPFVGMMHDIIMSEVEARLKQIKPQTEEIVVNYNGQKNQVKGLTHKAFKTVLAYVSMDEPVYLYGRAGTGKNVLAKQIAEALGLNFYFANAVTQEHVLTGFIDAMGNYHETEFFRAFTQGGLFMLDEMDASIPEVLILLNAAIANRYFVFPTGKVEAHPDFRVIAAGNTTGTGATYEYNGRSQLDAASLDRFAMVEVDYDVRLEKMLANDDADLVDFVHDLRKTSEAIGRAVTITYRGIGRVAKMREVLGEKEAIRTGIVKGMDEADIKALCQRMTKGGKYLEALKSL